MSGPGGGTVRRLLVVVPARDEQGLIGACLDSLARAATRVRVPVLVSVVLDRCVDGTAAEVAARPWVRSVSCQAGKVGVARRVGVAHALAWAQGQDGPLDLHRTWVACTDADSQVPPDWLEHQLELADAGADLVLGTVTVSRDDATTQAWRLAYDAALAASRLSEATGRRPPRGHPHVHGANLGVRADVYLSAGGFAPVPAHEDELLVRAVERLPSARVQATVGAAVSTSGRRLGRAPHGVAADLRALAARGAPSPRAGVGVAPARLAGPVCGQ